MKIYRVVLTIIDFDDVGEKCADLIEGARYPNDCINPQVRSVDSREIGDWDDTHPLNNRDTCEAEYQRLFGALEP